VPIDDPMRFRIEMTFSRGADLSPLEVIIFFLSIYPRKRISIIYNVKIKNGKKFF
jgi:hypothetical protein